MSKDGLTALQDQLRVQPPAGLAGLRDDDLHHFAEAIRAARHRQAEHLKDAGDQAFRLVPRLLRGPIKRIVGA